MILPKTYVFLLIIAFTFVNLSFTAKIDICTRAGLIDPAVIDASIGSGTTSKTMTTCRQLFKVPFTTMTDPYLIFEVKFLNLAANPTFTPYFFQKFNPDADKLSVYSPVADITPKTRVLVDGKNDDANGYRNSKDYHYIILSKADIPPNQDIYYAIYNLNLETNSNQGLSVDYEFTVRTSSTYPCPQNCLYPTNGECSNNLKRCICKAGFFDSDCSVSAQKINLLEASEQILTPEKWTYFYFSNMNAIDHDILMTFNKEKKGKVSYSFLFNPPNYFQISNEYNTDGTYTLYNNEESGILQIQSGDIKDHKSNTLLIGAYNEETTQITASVFIEDHQDNSVIRNIAVYTALVVSLAVLTLWAIATMLKYKYHTQMLSALQAFQTEREEEKTLTKKDMNIYFPKKKFGELTSSFSQTLCSVCLEDFESEASCRQLYCEHIYHSSCIEAWLGSHYNCPNCKKEMNKLAIEEFLKNKKEKKSLLPKNSEVQPENGGGEEGEEEIPLPEIPKSKESSRIVRINAEALEIRQSVKEVDEMVLNKSRNETPNKRNAQLELEVSPSDKSRNHEIQLPIESPVLDESKKIDEFRKKLPTRVGTTDSHFNNYPQAETPLMKLGTQESRPNSQSQATPRDNL